MADGVSTWRPRALPPLVSLATFALVVTLLAKGRDVLLPIGLALILSFVLTPMVRLLEKMKLPRGIAVGLAIAVALAIVGGFAFVLNLQVNELSTQLARYSNSMRAKVAKLRSGGPGAIDSIQKTVNKVSKELDEKVDTLDRATAVRVVPDDQSALERFKATVGPIFEPLAIALIVLVLVAFLLSKREDVRDRLIRLVGNVSLTTRTIDEAVQRIYRYLLSQLVINVGFGSIIAIGLYFIGVPYSVLWGVLASMLRFVPYVGSMLAMTMPLMLSFAKFPGWTETLEVLGLFLGLDSITAYFVEPLLIGHRTGVSALALLISTLFWTWLWGPLGLVLSTPITVVIAVLGRHVPQLHFLSVLLGDEPALASEVSYYQRLLARDEDEATELAEKLRTETTPENVLSSMLGPALAMAARDRSRDQITDADATFVLAATGDLASHFASELQAAGPLPPRRGQALLVAARSHADELLVEMLATMLGQVGYESTRMPASTPVTELLAQLKGQRSDVVCIAAIPPAGGTHARHLCRQLRSAFPELPIVVLRPNLDGEQGAEELTERMLRAGAQRVCTSLLLTSTQLDEVVASQAAGDRFAPLVPPGPTKPTPVEPA